ncbi:hypothetical protein KV557_40420, partial [Kitasatospora aureofaciens]|uniref:hypothetical protein n=1 Tax=Kitasatospora aureofaciens TaxID=1894 RepID=UPI001C4584E8
SGGRGGNTADLAIYTGGSTNNHANDDDYENETQTQPIDIYTPESGTGGQAVAQNVRAKLSSQAAGGVCVDLSNIAPGSRAPILATLRNQLNVPRGAVVIVHANGVQLEIIGELPQ